DDARQLHAAELVAHARDEVLHRELALAETHLVLRERGARFVEAGAQVLETRFALAEIRAERVENGSSFGECFLRGPRRVERCLEALFVRDEDGGGFAELARTGFELRLQTPRALAELGFAAREALERAARSGELLARAREGDLALHEQLLLHAN